LVAFAPAAQGSANPDGPGANTTVAKGGSCKDACFHAEATCRGKRASCMAARQRCVKGCR
jgi:hypothetical protein